MILTFGNAGTEDIYDGTNSRAARKTGPRSCWKVARRKLDMLNAASAINDLLIPPGNRLETLLGKRTGEWSIRINQQFRICFRWHHGDASDVEIVDYH